LTAGIIIPERACIRQCRHVALIWYGNDGSNDKKVLKVFKIMVSHPTSTVIKRQLQGFNFSALVSKGMVQQTKVSARVDTRTTEKVQALQTNSSVGIKAGTPGKDGKDTGHRATQE
jgi:hypothetical protein